MKRKASRGAKKKVSHCPVPARNFLRDRMEAAEKEAQLREYAFLDGPYLIAGAPIRVMRLRDFHALASTKNALLLTGSLDPMAVADFLWRLSFEYCDDLRAKADWCNALPDAEDEEIAQALSDYLDLLFIDRPGGGDDSTQYTSAIASVVDFLASEYGWSEAECLDLPLPRMFQLQRAAMVRKGMKVAVFNRLSDRATSAYLIALQAVPEEHRDQWTRIQSAELLKERAA